MLAGNHIITGYFIERKEKKDGMFEKIWQGRNWNYNNYWACFLFANSFC